MYKLMTNRFGNEAGTIVYPSTVHDYGLARDDTNTTNEEHISVSLKPDGGYPLFTVPVDQLVKIIH